MYYRQERPRHDIVKVQRAVKLVVELANQRAVRAC